MSVEATRNFRDKAVMKDLLRGAGIPCARHRRACSEHDAWAFAGEVGFPMVVKPVEGAASQETFKVDDPEGLRHALDVLHPSAHAQVILEEFLTGQEHSCDSFWLRGKRLFHTINRYYPSCLDVMRNPWMQWVVVLPQEVDDPRYDDIRAASLEAHRVLGMGTGMSHTEWFRRPDGSLAISEIGARPPGAQFTTIVSRSSDFDALRAWAGLMVYEEFDQPVRKYSAGCCYLRGQGTGEHVCAVHGWEEVQAKIGHLLTDVKLPQPGAPRSVTYEGEGYLIARHPETRVVEEALKWAVSMIRVELA
jgi:phosphoribosylaminoimidazole carboxylase (NCAIR synthetase)